MSRGIPGRSSAIVLGYGGIPRAVLDQVDEAVRQFKLRGNGKPRELLDEIREIVISAKLIEVDGREPKKKIQGTIRVRLDDSSIRTIVEHLETNVCLDDRDIKIMITRYET
jgi:hypothetical protein